MPKNGQGNRGSNSGRGGGNQSRSNNPEGRNQYSGGMMNMVRERPIAAAATAAGAVAAGIFLWSKRSQITDQLNAISDQLGEWTDNMLPQGDDSRSQSAISEEAMTLRETGGKSKNEQIKTASPPEQ